MQSRSNLQILYAILILMVAQAHCQQLMCYICDDCTQITKDTPKEICDETFFNKDTTTTILPTASTEETTEIITSEKTTDTTTETPTTIETTTTTINETTKSPIPTAPTAGPVITTTPLPTPPTPGSVAGPIDSVAAQLNITTSTTPFIITANASNVDAPVETTYLKPIALDVQPAQLRIRQLRSVGNPPNVSYHCFTVQETVNGKVISSRGCSSVNQTEAVCPHLTMTNNKNYTACTPCTNSLCNSSGAIGASAVAVILGLVCALLLGFPA